MTPEKIIQKQFEGFVERDLEKFCSCYQSDIKLYNFPENEPFLQGMAAFRANYQDVFDNSPNLNAQLISRMVFKNKVIDREIITNRKEVKYRELVVIYEVEDGLISAVRYIS